MTPFETATSCTRTCDSPKRDWRIKPRNLAVKTSKSVAIGSLEDLVSACESAQDQLQQPVAVGVRGPADLRIQGHRHELPPSHPGVKEAGMQVLQPMYAKLEHFPTRVMTERGIQKRRIMLDFPCGKQYQLTHVDYAFTSPSPGHENRHQASTTV